MTCEDEDGNNICDYYGSSDQTEISRESIYNHKYNNFRSLMCSDDMALKLKYLEEAPMVPGENNDTGAVVPMPGEGSGGADKTYTKTYCFQLMTPLLQSSRLIPLFALGNSSFQVAMTLEDNATFLQSIHATTNAAAAGTQSPS